MMNKKEAISHKLVDPAFLLRLVRIQQGANTVFAAAFLLVALAWGWQRLHPPAAILIGTSRDGRPVAVVPLNKPNLSDRKVLQWVSTTVRRAYAIDWRNYARQLDDDADRFTVAAWDQFGASLKKSGNLKKIRSARMVGWVKPDGAARIVNRGVIGRYFTWEIVDPITVYYENNDYEITDRLAVKLFVRRAAFGHDHAGVAIEQINAVPR
ncbi:MAG: DotI/IcmL/TraM family protein [Acidiphilium sp.]|nr:DotI/IcmL/TraM family protein [Acidiphilium sp.]MDD4937055.1 DotI/IcmL/TraM family protein [Acidiphilium sp.]